MSHAKMFRRERSSPRTSATRYGVLVGTIKASLLDDGRSPHYEIWVAAADGNYRVAVNVQSDDQSEVYVHYDTNYVTASPALDLAALAGGAQGFRELTTGTGGNGLDYVRDGLFDLDDMQQVPDAGASDSLAARLGAQVAQAHADPTALAIVFGDYFRDGGAATEDKQFGFSPEQGLHDIHMMQGNAGSFERDNTTHGDGALFIRFGNGRTTALFTRFATQGTETDDQGNPTDVEP